MPGNLNKIFSTSWSEDKITTHYAVKLISALDQSSFDPFLGKSKIYGQFSSVKKINSSTFDAIRDPLGIGKLFYTETEKGELFFSEHYTDLFRYKSKIYSVPAGKQVRIGTGGLRELIQDIRPGEAINKKLRVDSLQNADTDTNGQLFQKKLTDRLNNAFSLIRNLENAGWKIFVALSGGLDSSIIANASVRHLSSPIACTLDLGRSEDAEKSSLIAKHLGIKHLVFDTSDEEIVQTVENAPLLCQDFRDFNVHCAALNLLLAKNIRSWSDSHSPLSGEKIIVLTGDLMNEYTCDYAEETVGDRVYYKLPRVGKKDLQRYLIRGLDTSDRELLPFRHYGLNCIQPYAIVFDLYANLSEHILEAVDVKRLLNAFLVPREVRDFIPKAKLRAQVGSKDSMGILGLCHKLGFNDRYFRGKLLEQAHGAQEQIPIFVGKYDVENFS
ncbi:MAG: asparagine synthase-related protein [Desulfobulbaceae bacterium]